jgi:SAM-dependent methyltransferase
MKDITERPFYGEYAWAYDLIITAPVAERCDFIEAAWSRRGLIPGSRILDAGCGTGSYSIELARRGYRVSGLDLSPELVAEARKKSMELTLPMSFAVGELSQLSPDPPYDGILCRGVLNDVTDDVGRRDAFSAFARALRRDGVLIFDVREWESSESRKMEEPVFEKYADTDQGRLTFRSVTRIDPATRQLFVTETHTIRSGRGAECVSEYHFVMRCWTREELGLILDSAGFGAVETFGAYNHLAPVGSTDRIVAVVSLNRK